MSEELIKSGIPFLVALVIFMSIELIAFTRRKRK